MKNLKHIDLLIIIFILVTLFAMPVLFVKVDGVISWKHVIKIWQDNSLLIPLFAFNHWVLMPKFMEHKKYIHYGLSIFIAIVVATMICNLTDPQQPLENRIGKPMPVPPYADMLMYSILIIGIDIGLFFSKMWQKNEKSTADLKLQNTKMEFELLKNQVSPHFFMNTLNNIYALSESSPSMAKTAIMKLSKMMRYLLYENASSCVKISKEFEFIQSYIDLMRLRYTDKVIFNLNIPQKYKDIDIPPMLFISYIENAAKYGISYQFLCEINIDFEFSQDYLCFRCSNPIIKQSSSTLKGGLGLKNSESRLRLLYGDNYKLKIDDIENKFIIDLIIPIK